MAVIKNLKNDHNKKHISKTASLIYLEAMQDAIRNIPNTQEIIKNIIDENKKTFNNLNDYRNHSINLFKSFISAYSLSINYKKNLKIYNKIEEQYVVIMQKCNIPPIIDDFDHTQLSKIVKSYSEMNFNDFKTEFKKEIMDYYSNEQLINKLKKWKDLSIIKNRYSILESIINAHINGNYLLSLPVMLIQVEGLLGDYNMHKGQTKGCDLKKYLAKLLKEKKLNKINDSMKNFIINNIYTNFNWGDDIKSPISRHAIIHGAYTEYGTEFNSLRAILCFDFLINRIRFKNL